MDLSAATTLLSSPQTHPTHRQGSTPNVTASATKLVGHAPSSERNAWQSGIEAPIASMAHMMRGGLPQPTSQVDLLPLPLWERPPQVALDTSPQKMDPEMKIFLDAFASRRQTVRVATAPSSPAKMVPPTPSMPESSQLAARPKTTHAYSSVLRMHQMGEIEEIRLAFERHRLSFENQVFERALLIPEDKTTAECVAHLPLPGSRLPDNPLLAQKSLLFKMSSTLSTKKPKKKAKKKKKAKMKAKK
ncbi:hypothetical protein, variant [Aphanomyces astaci]|nr:hypothetical protein, variant [Aphanomyces astaci]ETV72791.1 hypothetical protein, variant [Aphanomyces astaci]|eukprot:XP_009837577.1 hypothetical protein, variant [Aphanomyces astaci]